VLLKTSLEQLNKRGRVVRVATQEKEALFDVFATVAKALSSGRRAELIDVLAQGERSVDSLASEINQSLANTSQHLQVLARAGLILSRRDGNRVLYRIADDSVEELWTALRAVAAERVAGAEQVALAYLGDRTGLEQVSRDELAQRLDDGVLVWDVRPQAEFEAGHVQGARSVPPEELQRRLDEVPDDVEVVAYCRGPFCVYADEAVRALTSRERRARRLEDGFPEWRRAGLPVAFGAEGNDQ
jgi:rhodanese-related sulfurtransferase/predicted transcriptional regulator